MNTRTEARAPLPLRSDLPAPLVREPALVSAWLTELDFCWRDATQGARRKSVVKGERLFLEGQSADAVYVIEQGRMLLTSCSPDGKERHLMIVGPSGLVGDCAWPAARQYVLSAISATDACLAVVPLAQMREALARHPHLQRQQQEMAGLRFRIMLQHLALQASNSARRRVSHHLLGLMNSYGKPQRDGVLIAMAFTQQDMADLCALSRVSVSNTLGALEREGVVARCARLVLIRDAQRLARMATA